MPPKSRSTTARKPAAKRSPKRKRVKVRSPITVSLFHCPKCKLRTNNPFKRWGPGHKCLIGWTAAQRRTVAQRQASKRNLETARRKRGS